MTEGRAKVAAGWGWLTRRVAIASLAAAMLAAAPPAAEGRQGRCQGHDPTVSVANPQLHARGDRRVIVGTPHRDVIAGSRLGDWIVGGGGADVICGGGGKDYVFVGNVSHHDEPTRLNGGPGADYIDGSFAADRIQGGPGDDRIDGEFGDDRIWGASGDDFIRAQMGDDRISAGRGEDHVEASSGADLVHGGPGADKISTGPDADTVFGDRGDDSIFLVWGDDVGHGGRGNDALHGGRGEDLCFGDLGRDLATACEHRRSIERTHHGAAMKRAAPRRAHHRQRAHAGRPHNRAQRRRDVRPFERVTAYRRIERFLHRLQGHRVIKAAAITRHQLHRSAALGHSARRAVDRRYERRLRHHHRVRAVFRRSVERYRVRRISAAISNQIDRLRWTPHRRRR